VAIDNVEIVFCTLAFVVPGFLVHRAMSAFVPLKAEHPQLSLLRFLALSCGNYGFWSGLIYLLISNGYFAYRPVQAAVAWFFVIFVSPILAGALIGYLSQRDFWRRLLQRCGLNPIHGIPTAWDYRFFRTAPVWVLVTLNDGSRVAGLFGSESFASSDRAERDIYLQSVFDITGDGPWRQIPNSGGILICKEQVRYVEFWADDGKESIDGQQEQSR
jgi:hypothetical protein